MMKFFPFFISGNLLSPALDAAQQCHNGQASGSYGILIGSIADVYSVILRSTSASWDAESTSSLNRSVSGQALFNWALTQVCRTIPSLVKLGNALIKWRAPWVLYEEDSQANGTHTLKSVSVDLGSCLQPQISLIISKKVYTQLNFNNDISPLKLLSDYPHWASS